jgi:Tfp pilus assembly protein PilX
MNKLFRNQRGFIPMIIMILLIVIGMIVIAYLRVTGAHK